MKTEGARSLVNPSDVHEGERSWKIRDLLLGSFIDSGYPMNILRQLASPGGEVDECLINCDREGSVWGMSASYDRPDDAYEAIPETSKRRHREQNQLEFELDFFGRVLERDPLFGDALKVHADNLAAKGYYNRALQADLQLVRLRPDKPIPWYNLACSYAVLGMTERAFESLERSLRLGYRHLHHLRRDRDLKSLHRDPRFARLLRRY